MLCTISETVSNNGVLHCHMTLSQCLSVNHVTVVMKDINIVICSQSSNKL